MLNCLCKSSCKSETYYRIQAGLSCTDLCTAKRDNMLTDEIASDEDRDEINDIDGSDIKNDDE